MMEQEMMRMMLCLKILPNRQNLHSPLWSGSRSTTSFLPLPLSPTKGSSPQTRRRLGQRPWDRQRARRGNVGPVMPASICTRRWNARL
jgi:hypothetical protein